ncbi:hypothetical protein PG994_008350 [Apiospora phragmitis]|uniref:Uncharacterized protein n=1 Tax=Apiospora phragmitis TaxID=2905665 RepID=A0ABR1UVX1_9PEZI
MRMDPVGLEVDAGLSRDGNADAGHKFVDEQTPVLELELRLDVTRIHWIIAAFLPLPARLPLSPLQCESIFSAVFVVYIEVLVVYYVGDDDDEEFFIAAHEDGSHFGTSSSFGVSQPTRALYTNPEFDFLQLTGDVSPNTALFLHHFKTVVGPSRRGVLNLTLPMNSLLDLYRYPGMEAHDGNVGRSMAETLRDLHEV